MELELDIFEREEREFSKDAAQWAKTELLACGRMTPAMWWRMYGCHVSGLAIIALKVFSRPITYSDCKRYLSLFGAI